VAAVIVNDVKDVLDSNGKLPVGRPAVDTAAAARDQENSLISQ
jgi:hypothetical protein